MNYTHLSIEERCCLRKYYNEGNSLRKIAELMGRNVSTISREIMRNKTYMNCKPAYYPHTAQKKSNLRKSYCHRVCFGIKLRSNTRNEKKGAADGRPPFIYGVTCMDYDLNYGYYYLHPYSRLDIVRNRRRRYGFPRFRPFLPHGRRCTLRRRNSRLCRGLYAISKRPQRAPRTIPLLL